MSMCVLPGMFLVPEMQSDARKCHEDGKEFGASNAVGLEDACVKGQADLSNTMIYTPQEVPTQKADGGPSTNSEIGRGIQDLVMGIQCFGRMGRKPRQH